MGLNGWYVGDGMPLCSDLPKRHFLKKGATYRLLGSSPSPRLLNEPDEWATREGVRRVFLRKDSALYEKICNKESPNNKSCRYQSKLVLDVDLPCTGTECDIDAPRVVEVEAGLFYEYSRMPCANQAFYDNAKLMQRVKQVNYYCEDPRMEVGGISCCKHGSNDAIMSLELFEGEQMTFASAKARCLENNLEVCESPSIDCNGCDRNLGHWTSQPCDLMTKIDLEGKVAVVHSSTHEKAKDKFSWEVQEDTKTFFRADWSGSIDQMLLSNYDSKCAEMGCLRDSFDNLCLCPTSVSETQAFTRAPSKQEVLRDLHIGYFHPSAYDKEFQTQDLGSGVLMHSTDGLISDKSIFEVVDENGITHLRKNVKSTVSLGNGPLSFRNPPNLMSVVNPEPRDGHYEIDAGLDHYFVSWCFLFLFWIS